MWKEDKEQLKQTFEFKDFTEAMTFVNRVAVLAEKANHHPDIFIKWNTVELHLSTHDADDAITQKDKDLAVQIDGLLVKNNTQLPVFFPDEIKFYGDGGSRGNPGPAACGFVLMTLEDSILETGGEYMGVTTNNQAEYHSLEMGLEAALEHGVKKIHVYMDSMLVINQIKGSYKVRSPELMPRYEHIMELVGRFEAASFTHVPRAQNALADAEVNRILDSV